MGTLEGQASADEAAPAEAQGEEAAPVHNYILIIDNSRSTTGRHSLGSATDPKGLRFDAAKLVYQNVLSSAATGSRGKIGVIVFCGTKNCVTYGPLNIDDENLDAEIGNYLNAAANEKRRDNFTDIRTALATARDMLGDFDGSSSVLLLTDGVNDLTNKNDPFNRPENIAANEESVAIARQIRESGADFSVVALTSQEDVQNTDAFMMFINDLAEAGGGEEAEDGSYSNVLMATQGNLAAKLLQNLIRAESASETIETIVDYTPIRDAFHVPYNGITDATVNLTFMPEDKEKLDEIELISPSGESYAVWERGKASGTGEDDLDITESRSYIMLKIPSPEAGEWTLEATSNADGGEADSGVLINAVVRFHHNLRLRVDMAREVYAGDLLKIAAWFQSYDGEAFRDLTDSDIYGLSEATLTMIAPDGQQKTAEMKWNGSNYAIGFRPRIPGVWTAQVKVKNPYIQETVDDITFEVIPAPTPTPEPTPESTPEPGETPTPEPTQEPAATAFWVTEGTPTPEPTPTPTPAPTRTPKPSPTPKVVPIEDITVAVGSVVTAEDGKNYLVRGNTPVIVAWMLEGKTDYQTAELLENGEVVLSDIQNGDSLDRALFKEGPEYELRVTAMPKNGTKVDAKPTVRSYVFEAAPAVANIAGIALSAEPVAEEVDGLLCLDGNGDAVTLTWEIGGETDSVEVALTEDGAPMDVALESGAALSRDLFKDDSLYQLRVSAVPKNGTISKASPVSQALTFKVYPKCQPVTGLTLEIPGAEQSDGVYSLKTDSATVAWRYDAGIPDHFDLAVTDPQGAPFIREVLNAGQGEYRFTMTENGAYSVTLTAVPKYAPSEAVNASASLAVKPHIATFLEKYWYFIAGGAALLVAALVGLILLAKARSPKVTGSLRVKCEALDLDVKLPFEEGLRGVKLNSPLTAHPVLKKLKGGRARELLKNVKVNMCRANNLGKITSSVGSPESRARNEEIMHRPNESLISLVYTNPGTKAQEACYVGRHDVGASTMDIADGGTTYTFEFSPR